MAKIKDKKLKERIEWIRHLTRPESDSVDHLEAASLAQTILHNTVGEAHPLMANLRYAIMRQDGDLALATTRAVIKLYDESGLVNPRLLIAHEIEDDLLDIALIQIQFANKVKDASQQKVHLALSAFLAGTALEDALRRLCEYYGITYDTHRTSISILQSLLYNPAKQIEIISSSENMKITTWGDTRDKADHGRFFDITQDEMLTMVMGVRAFIDRHLPSL